MGVGRIFLAEVRVPAVCSKQRVHHRPSGRGKVKDGDDETRVGGRGVWCVMDGRAVFLPSTTGRLQGGVTCLCTIPTSRVDCCH